VTRRAKTESREEFQFYVFSDGEKKKENKKNKKKKLKKKNRGGERM